MLGGVIREILARHYDGNQLPVAFVDESFETNRRDSFYVVAVAIVEGLELHNSRNALSSFYGGRALHAAPMFANSELETLRQATQLVSRQNDGLDIVVCAPIDEGQDRDQVRSKCLGFAVTKVHRDYGTKLFVLDSLGTPTENQRDQRTFHDLRSARSRQLAREVVAFHCRPSEEILLGLPDVLAWSYRQEHVRGDRAWFEPMREFTEVTVL